MKIEFINNDGGGFADFVEVEDGLTAQQLFEQRMGKDADPRDYLIKINNRPTTRNQQIADGDRVSITPTKQEGA